jgi:hypothetical protein
MKSRAYWLMSGRAILVAIETATAREGQARLGVISMESAGGATAHKNFPDCH